MTLAFEKFNKQIETSGSDYGDGFDHSHFDGLTPAEERNVIERLCGRATDGDNVAISGLGILGTHAAKVELLELLHNTLPPSEKHIDLCEALWTITQQPSWQLEILKDLAATDQSILEYAVVTLNQTSNSQTVEEVQETFIHLLLSSNSGLIKSQSAGGLCVSLGLAPFSRDRTPERLALQRSLRNANEGNIDKYIDDIKALVERRASAV